MDTTEKPFAWSAWILCLAVGAAVASDNLPIFGPAISRA